MRKPEPIYIYLLCVSTFFALWKVAELGEQLPGWAFLTGAFLYIVGAIAAAHFDDIQRLLLSRRDSSIIRKSSTSSADAK